MNRAERRARTSRAAQRRFDEVAAIESRLMVRPFGSVDDTRRHVGEAVTPRDETNWFGKTMSSGFFKKLNPFTHPKVPKRGWQKKENEKRAAMKAKKRNPLVEEFIPG